ncbi:MAG: N-methyl-D-aspartate receptor NMDAR2C subunit [Pseudomonadota bacterium]|nr:N-methyl-D-aspartate receptor NMDAR2C subunit [Pseudomonadota bacterium]
MKLSVGGAESLLISWNRCWSGIGANGDGASLKNDLVTAWNEPQRKYHTLQHLHGCLSIFEEFQHLAEHPHEVELAIWFHDAVYDIKGKNNEQKSAEWAGAALDEAGVSKERITRIYDLIMATEHSAMDELDTPDKQLLVDIDLAILGCESARFSEYEKQVREEYSYVPGFLFRIKRRQVLRSFLDRQPIYSTPELQARFESQARKNLSG